MRLFTILIFAALLLYGCMNASSETKAPTIARESVTVQQLYENSFSADWCFVLCDFSASQGTSLQTVKNKAQRIYQSAKLKTKIRFYDVNAVQFAAPFFEYTRLVNRMMKPSEKERLRRDADSMGTILNSSLTSPAGSQSTCINRGISAVAQSLGDLAPHKTETIWIIVLSDMLEDCTYDWGRIDIDNASYEQALKMLDKMPKPLFGLKNYKNVHIKLTACSGDNKVSSEKLFVFWKKLLSRYDYNLTTPINNELPAWVND